MTIEDDRIEKLKRKLYSRNEEPMIDIRSEVKRRDVNIQNAWGETSGLSIPEDMRSQQRAHPVLKKFLFAAFLFFVVSVLFSLYIFFGGRNLISASNVNIQVAGPSSVASGEEIDLLVSLVNQNKADLELVQYTVEYPDGSTADKNSNTPLTQTVENVGTIASGSSLDRTAKFFLFGDKGVSKTVKFKIEYKITGSNAVFTKEKDYDLSIGSSPVILDVSVPQEVNAGQEISFTTTISSNSSSLLQNVVVVADYPYGFTYDNSSLKPTKGNNVWNIGDLKSGEKKILTINGKLIAQDKEQRTFRFSVGTQSIDRTKDIDTVLSQAQPTITVSKPFILTTLAMAGNTSDTVAVTSATVVNGSLHFTNTLPDQLGDVSVQINISGSALDRQSVRSDSNGFYHSENGAINWDKNSNNDFALIDPGDSRDLSFSFSSLKLGITDKNPEVDVTTIINGSRTSPVGAVEKISTTITKTVKILANLVLISKSLRGGPIPNTGPFPPKAENVSTYTIDWALTNMWNDVSGAKVTTTLPPYVEWTGVVNPQTANITYDSASHTVTWSPDSVSAGAGFTQSPKEVFFQVKIHPSLSQVQATPAITSDLVLSAKDNFTDSTIKLTNNPLTTQAFDLNDNGFVTK